jgi:hypothetical protein
MKQPIGLRIIPIIFTIVGIAFLGGAAVAWFSFPEDRESAMILTGVFSIMGAVFTSLGVVFLAVLGGSGKKRRRLKETGERVNARILDLEPNFTIRVNGRCPWRLLCEYEEGGMLYRCRSQNLWEYPSLRGDTVPVYRNPRNYREYYVDVEAVLRPTVEL